MSLPLSAARTAFGEQWRAMTAAPSPNILAELDT
jgi:hypothetical protein